jgi:small subunit ribosomal protein S20
LTLWGLLAIERPNLPNFPRFIALRIAEGAHEDRHMANTKSAKKAARQSDRRTDVNKARRSRMRSSVRKVEEAIASGNKEAALAAMKEAEPILASTAQKGIIHRKSASRKVSRLTKRIVALGKA